MTSVSPPTYYFDGITFNSAFYTTSSSGGLTQAQANALYLKKNTADTASALETFSGGINVNAMNPITTTGLITVGTSSTFTDLKGAVKASNGFQTPSLDPVLGGGNFNICNGTASTINVGTASATAVNIGSSSALTTTNGALTATGLITANNGLTMGTGKNITLQPATSYVSPADGQLGYLFSGTTAIPVIVTGSLQQLNLITLPIGTWYVFYNASFVVTVSNVSIIQTAIGLGTNTSGFNIDNFVYGANVNASPQTGIIGNNYASPAMNGSAIIRVTTSTTYYLNFLAVWSGGTLSCNRNTLSAVRIA